MARLICIWVFVIGAAGSDPIDREIAGSAGGPLAGRSSDAEFFRRIQLDLTGIIPTAEEARRFLADPDPDRRVKLADRLLASPEYARRMADAFTVTLLERRAGKTIPDPAWKAYLEKSFAEDNPWDRLIREILLVDGLDPATRPAIKFWSVAGRNDANVVTRDVGRLFLGMDLTCAQCHNHPSVKAWKQADYMGIYASLKQSSVKTHPKTKDPLLADGVMKAKVEFQSVFKPGIKKSTGPRVPGGEEIEVPPFEKGKEFETPPRDGLPGVPKFRPRMMLGKALASPENPRFARSAVNRFWFLLMGRGLIEPLDFDHPKNPPTHPALLDRLAKDFAADGFRVKRLVRRIVLTESYQRSGLLPEGADAAPERYRAAIPKPLSPEQLCWSLLRATGNLDRFLAAPVPKDSKFNLKDYVNNRIPTPDNMRDVLHLFTAVFGSPPGAPEVQFQPSSGQALFFKHEKLILGWLKPHPGNLVDRLGKIDDAGAVAEELYLSVLSRTPIGEERAEVEAYIKKHGARRAEALADLAWVLLASAEFRLNH